MMLPHSQYHRVLYKAMRGSGNGSGCTIRLRYLTSSGVNRSADVSASVYRQPKLSLFSGFCRSFTLNNIVLDNNNILHKRLFNNIAHEKQQLKRNLPDQGNDDTGSVKKHNSDDENVHYSNRYKFVALNQSKEVAKQRRALVLRVQNLASHFEEGEAPRGDEILDIVREEKKKGLEWYEAAIVFYSNRQGKYRKGTVEFIEAVLKDWDTDNTPVTRDMYNSLLLCIPEKRYHLRSIFDYLFPVWTRHVVLATDVLQRMENNRICPDINTLELIEGAFGRTGVPSQKMHQMIFWFTKYDIKPTDEFHELNQPAIKDIKIRIVKCLEQMENYTGGVYASVDDNKDRNTIIRVHEVKNNSNTEAAAVDGDKNDQDSKKTPSGYGISLLSEAQASLIKSIDSGHEESTEDRLAHVDSDLGISVDGPYVHWFDNTLLPYYTMKCSSERIKDRIIGICVLDSQDNHYEKLNQWVNDWCEEHENLSKVTSVFIPHKSILQNKPLGY